MSAAWKVALRCVHLRLQRPGHRSTWHALARHGVHRL